MNKYSQYFTDLNPNQSSANEQGTFGDTIDAVQMGGAQALSGLFEAFGATSIADSLNGVADDQLNQMSQSGRDALAQQIFETDENGNLALGDGATNLKTWWLNLASAAGQMIPTMVPGGLAAKGISAVAKLGKAAKIATAGVAHGVTGGTSATGQAGLQGRQAIEEMPWKTLIQSKKYLEELGNVYSSNPDMTEKDMLVKARENVANQVSKEIMTDPKLLIANFATSAIGDTVIARSLGKRLADTVKGSMLKGFGTEFATEAVQGGVEHVSTQEGIQSVDKSIDPYKGALASSLNEGILGGVMGGVAAVPGALIDRKKPAPKTGVDSIDDAMQQTSDIVDDIKNKASSNTTPPVQEEVTPEEPLVGRPNYDTPTYTRSTTQNENPTPRQVYESSKDFNLDEVEPAPILEGEYISTPPNPNSINLEREKQTVDGEYRQIHEGEYEQSPQSDPQRLNGDVRENATVDGEYRQIHEGEYIPAEREQSPAAEQQPALEDKRQILRKQLRQANVSKQVEYALMKASKTEQDPERLVKIASLRISKLPDFNVRKRQQEAVKQAIYSWYEQQSKPLSTRANSSPNVEITPEVNVSKSTADVTASDNASRQDSEPQLVEHETKRGKTLQGYIAKDLTRAQALEIDPYTFKKNGGWFLRQARVQEREQGKQNVAPAANATSQPQTEVKSNVWSRYNLPAKPLPSFNDNIKRISTVVRNFTPLYEAAVKRGNTDLAEQIDSVIKQLRYDYENDPTQTPGNKSLYQLRDSFIDQLDQSTQNETVTSTEPETTKEVVLSEEEPSETQLKEGNQNVSTEQSSTPTSEGALEGVQPEQVSSGDDAGNTGSGRIRSNTDDRGRDQHDDGVRDESSRSLGSDQTKSSVRTERENERGTTRNRAPGELDGREERSDGRNTSRTGTTELTNAATAPENYKITRPEQLGAGGKKTKFKNNVAAITLAKELESSGRYATNEEKEVLSQFVGWGGLQEAFEDASGKPGKGWESQHQELKLLLTESEYDLARASTRNAHYTSPEIISGIYKAIQQFGVKSGSSILEPAMGVGNFFGLMPDNLASKAKLTGVEYDPVTGLIAKHLYPAANIHIKGFQELRAANDFFDLVVGNPPFGKERLLDKHDRHLNNFNIHSYFTAKSIDKTRPGGILAFVISNGFMDSGKNIIARKYLDERAELLGAIRLPNNAFSKNAGTEVTTDILFFQKRPEKVDSASAWVNVTEVNDTIKGGTVPVNQYFADNPEMMLGQWGKVGSMYRPDQPALVSEPGQNTERMLADAIKRLPKNVYERATVERDPQTDLEQHYAHQVNADDYGIGAFFEKEGALYRREEDTPDGKTQTIKITEDTPFTAKQTFGEKRIATLKGLIKLRTVLREQLRLETTGADKAKTDNNRQVLNDTYERLVSHIGKPLHGDAVKQLFRDDPDYPLILSLEKSYDKGVSKALAKKYQLEAREASAKKADIFTRSVAAPVERVTRAENATDALSVSLNQHGEVNVPEMANLTGKTEQDIVRELHDERERPLIYQDPDTGQWLSAEEYLSGNVLQKLEKARNAGLDSNVSALEKVQPAPVKAGDIYIKPGTPWIPDKVYSAFAREVLGAELTITYVNFSGVYSVVKDSVGNVSSVAAAKYGTPDHDPISLYHKALNSKSPTVYYAKEKPEDPSVVNRDATEQARAKQQELIEAFNEWVFKDATRRALLTKTYNRMYNNWNQRQYDGSHLLFPGKVPDAVIKPRRHQVNGAWRIVSERTALLDHVVGAGKTFTAIMGAMELKRLGFVRKNMFVVPNHLVGQWASDFYALYPGAKILAATKKDFEKNNRKKLFARIATGNWDAVIVAHSSFGFIPVSAEKEQQFINEQIADIQSAIDALKSAEGSRSRTTKQLEEKARNLKTKFESLADKPKDDLLTFEELGVDQLFVDEAHEFKNLAFATQKQRVAGLGNTAGSKKAFDMYMKSQLLLQSQNGEGLVFLTGTPVSNSLAELYTMLRYLATPQLKALGINSFDGWANTFAKEVTEFELDSTATKLKLNTRFSSFSNMPELMKLYFRVADAVTNDQIKQAFEADNPGKQYPLPKVKGGQPENVVVPISYDQSAYMQEIVERADEVANRTAPPQPGDDNMLSITNDARKAALDIRLVDPSAGDSPGSKLHEAADRITTIYKKWKKHKGTQLVFLDLSVPGKAANKERAAIQAIVDKARDNPEDDKAKAALEKLSLDELLILEQPENGFSAYDDLKQKLINSGVPESEIAFIHDYPTDAKKQELFALVNSGAIRVLFGSTAKMGAGTNVQKRLVALHHIDVPWRPSDIEQREGRIIRQGNELFNLLPDFEVEILRYATEKTYDARMWQTQEYKARMIAQMRSFSGEREMGDVGGAAASAAEMKAAASGNPLILEQVQLSEEIRRLEASAKAHRNNVYSIQDELREMRDFMDTAPVSIEQKEEVLSAYSQYQDDPYLDAKAKPSVTISGETFNDRLSANEFVKNSIQKQLVESGKKRWSLEIDSKKVTNQEKLETALINTVGSAEPFHANVNGRDYYAARTAGEAIKDLAEKLPVDSDPVNVGRFAGHDLEIMRVGDDLVNVGVKTEDGLFSDDVEITKVRQAFSSIESDLKHLRNRVEMMKRRLKDTKAGIGELEELGEKPFKDQGKLDEKKARLREVEKELTDEGGAHESDVVASLNREKSVGVGITKAEAVIAIERIKRGWGVKLIDIGVATRWEQFPEPLRAAVGDSIKNAEGFLVGNKAYINLEHIESESHLEKVLVHEILRHYGVRKLFGSKIVSQFVAIYNSLGTDKLKELYAKYDIPYKAYSELYGQRIKSIQDNGQYKALMIDELLAHMAPDNADPVPDTFWQKVQRLVENLRQFFREKLGFRNIPEYSERQLFEIISAAHRHLLSPDDPGGSRRYSKNVQEILTQADSTRKADAERSKVRGQNNASAQISGSPVASLVSGEGDLKPLQSILDKKQKTLVEAVKDALFGNKFVEGFKNQRLGALTLRQLAEVGKKRLPQITKYMDLVHAMIAQRNIYASDAADTMDEWLAWSRKNRDENDRLVELMHEATIEGVDPARPFKAARFMAEDRVKTLKNLLRSDSSNVNKEWNDELKEMYDIIKNEPRREAAHKRLTQKYRALPPEAKQIYKNVRDKYKARHNTFQRLVRERLERAEMNEKKRKQMLEKLNVDFGIQKAMAPYFPLSRQGNYYIDTFDEDGERVYMMFESEAEQQRVYKEIQKEYGKDHQIKFGKIIDKEKSVDGASLGFIHDVVQAIEKSTVNEEKTQELSDAVYQLYLQSLPTQSMRRQQLHRKGVRGFGHDAARNFASQMMKGAYQLSRLEYQDMLNEQMVEIREEAQKDGDNFRSELYNEMLKRHDWVMNPTNSVIANKLTGLGFVYLLGVSPAAAAINVTQNMVVALPVLASKYGWKKAAAMLSGTTKEFIASAADNVGDLAAGKKRKGVSLEHGLSPDEKFAFKEWQQMGLIDGTRSHDLFGIAENGSYEYSDKVHKAMTVVSKLFHKAEVYNRETTAIAAYRLAREAGKSHNEAVNEAAELTWDAHFDYTNVNRSRFMQSNFMKVATQFKQYSQNMTYYLVRNAHKSLKGETKEVRKEAMTQLFGSLVITGVLGGITTMPLWALYKLADIIGDDEDDPFDAETELNRYLVNLFGKDVADWMLHGVLGAGISPRVSLNGMWVRDPNRDLEGQDVWAFYAQQFAGPTLGGILPSAMSGASLLAKGEWERGLEKIVPKFIRDPAKALRYSSEGALTYKGDALKEKDDFSAWSLVMQSMGFTDAGLMKQYQENSAIKGYERAILDRRATLMTKYYLAWRERDSGEMAAVMKNIGKFNRTNPGIVITPKTLQRSVKTRERYRQNAKNGINVNKSLGYLNQAYDLN